MRTRRVAAGLSAVLGLMALAGCGDSKGGSDASTSGQTGSTGSTGAATSTGSGPTEASAGSSTQGATGSGGATTGSGSEVACGEALTCSDEVCVEEVFEPACSVPAPGDPCPRGTTPSQCGGDGQDCCCEPRPPHAFSCVPPRGCPGRPACECLAMICADDKECSQPDPGVMRFVCSPLPKP